MANPFDDLIPAKKGAFDDLIPQGDRSVPEKASRIVGQVAQNANDVIASTAGAPGDLVTAALKAGGLVSPDARSPVGSENIKSGIDYVATLPGRVGDAVAQRSLGPLTDDRTSRFNPENRSEKVAAGVGSGLGALATILLPAAAIARAAAPGGVTGRIAETLASQPAMQTASALTGGAATGATDNPYVGLAASLAVPVGASTARGVVSPVRNRLSAEEQRLVALAQQEGIPTSPAQQTGSPALRGIEETLNSTPFASGPMRDAQANQRRAFNTAVMSRTGTAADNAAPDTIQRAFQQAGQTFEDLAARTTVRPDGQFVQDIAQVEANYGRRLPTDVRPVFQSYMDDLQPLMQAVGGGANPQIAGDVYSTIRSDLARRIRETQNNPPLQRALGGLVEALDGAMERSTSGPLRNEWQAARREYQALMTIDKAMQGGMQADRAAGNIPFGALKGATVQGDKAGFARGRGQMNDLARIGDFLSTRVPNSGTPERLMWGNILSGGSLLGAGGIAAAGGMSPTALAMGATAAGLPAIASRLYNTAPVRAYLTNQAAGTTNFAPLLAAEGGRQGVQAEDRRMKEIARLLMRANEQGVR